MKIKIIFIIIFFFEMSLFAQSRREVIVNDIYSSIVDKSYPFYYLWEECGALKYKPEDRERLKTFTNYINDSILTKLLIKASTDTIPMKWDCSFIEKSKCSNDSVNVGILPVYNLFYSGKKMKKRVERQNRKILRKPKYKRSLYCFSRPIIDDRNEFALIEMSRLYASSY